MRISKITHRDGSFEVELADHEPNISATEEQKEITKAFDVLTSTVLNFAELPGDYGSYKDRMDRGVKCLVYIRITKVSKNSFNSGGHRVQLDLFLEQKCPPPIIAD